MVAPSPRPSRRGRTVADVVLPQDRLQPALLDRLTDHESDKTVEAREQRVMSKQAMRRAVLRDLAWLLNSTRPGRGVDTTRAERVRRSVLCFGLPAFSGRAASSIDTGDIERGIRQAIIDFEPRILPETLRVQASAVGQLDHHNIIGVEIRGEIWAQPIPLELLLRTEIDLESGLIAISDLGEGSRVA